MPMLRRTPTDCCEGFVFSCGGSGVASLVEADLRPAFALAQVVDGEVAHGGGQQSFGLVRLFVRGRRGHPQLAEGVLQHVLSLVGAAQQLRSQPAQTQVNTLVG